MIKIFAFSTSFLKFIEFVQCNNAIYLLFNGTYNFAGKFNDCRVEILWFAFGKCSISISAPTDQIILQNIVRIFSYHNKSNMPTNFNMRNGMPLVHL